MKRFTRHTQFVDYKGDLKFEELLFLTKRKEVDVGVKDRLKNCLSFINCLCKLVTYCSLPITERNYFCRLSY